jgi:hypothetical protein
MPSKKSPKQRKRKLHIAPPSSSDSKKTIQQSFLTGNSKPNQTTVYTYKLISAFLSNISDMLAFQLSSSSIAFMHGYNQSAVGNFPTIHHSPEYIKSFKSCIDRVQGATFFRVDESEYLKWSGTSNLKDCSVDICDIPNNNFWIFFDLAQLNIHKLYIRGIDDRKNHIGAYLGNFRVFENKVTLQIFKYLDAMTSWYKNPYTLELPLSVIQDRINDNNMDCTLNILFADMVLPSDDTFEFEIKHWVDLLIYSLVQVKNQYTISIFDAKTKIFKSSKKTFKHEIPTYTYKIIEYSL